jgi:hypothetical protein
MEKKQEAKKETLAENGSKQASVLIRLDYGPTALDYRPSKPLAGPAYNSFFFLNIFLPSWHSPVTNSKPSSISYVAS